MRAKVGPIAASTSARGGRARSAARCCHGAATLQTATTFECRAAPRRSWPTDKEQFASRYARSTTEPRNRERLDSAVFFCAEIPRYTARVAGWAARAQAGVGRIVSLARDRLAPLVVDPNHSERRAIALVVDPKRFQWPAVNQVTVPQNVARTQDGLNRQPLDQAEHARYESSCGGRIYSDQIGDRAFEVVSGFGRPNDLQVAIRFRTRARTSS